MKLFLKRDVSTDNRIFSVYDEFGKEKYSVISKNIKSNYSISIVDLNGNISCKIRKLPLISSISFLFKYNKKSITLVCVPLLNDLKCHYYGTNCHLVGSAVSKNFSLVNVDNSVRAACKKNASDCEIDICDPCDEMLGIATTVCINLINTVDNHVAQAV